MEEISVLHVDDDPNQFEFIKHFLIQADEVMKVTCVSTPDEVFKELETSNYDCLVTDFMMPLMNGIDLSKKVREKHTIPIILYTGQGSEEVAEAAFTIGVDDYLRKEMDPSHYQVLAKRIRNVVEKNQSKQLYQTVVEQTRDALSIFVDERIVFANKSALELFEVKTLKEIIGTNPFKIIPKGDKILEPGFHEFIHQRTQNDDLIFEVSSSPLQYNGKSAIICFVRDITEKRKLELEKKVSQERFKALVELAPDGIATFNSLGFMTFLNRAFCDITGFSNEELLGKHMTKLKTLRKRDLLKYLKTFSTVLKGNISPSSEFIYNNKDGTLGAGESHLGLIDVDGKKELLLIARNITEVKKQELKLNLLFENTTDGVIEIDNDATIKNINKAATTILKIKRNQILGNNLFETSLLDNNTQKRLKQEILNVVKHKKKRAIKIQLTRRDMSNILMEIHVHPVITDNEIFGIQLHLRDLSKNKESEHPEQHFETTPIETIDTINYPLIDHYIGDQPQTS